MKTKIYILFILLALTTHVGADNKSYLNQIKFQETKATAKKGVAELALTMDISGLNLNTQHSLRLTPKLVSNDHSKSVDFASLIINGNKRDKVLNRTTNSKKKELYGDNIYDVIRRKNKSNQQVYYSFSIPAENWMQSANLVIEEEVTGCANCGIAQNDLKLLTLTPPAMPNFQLMYLVPEAEVKTRNEQHTATLNFKIDQSELLYNYRNNAEVLTAAKEIINEVKSNQDIEITQFDIVGYASPEASIQHNLRLSQNRANAFAQYITNVLEIDRSLLKVSGEGEDWQLLRTKIEQSFLEKKNELLTIIDEVPNPDSRDAAIKKLDGGATYSTLLNQYYPQLRRIEYTIAYIVRPFDIEEIKEIIKSNPKLLSLNEMFLLAKTYEPTSKEFKQVFDVAMHIYPTSSIAIINSAAADIEAENYNSAIEKLNRLKDNPKAWNNLGVAYARLGDLEKAGVYFSKAAESKIQQAISNDEQLKLFIEDNK